MLIFANTIDRTRGQPHAFKQQQNPRRGLWEKLHRDIIELKPSRFFSSWSTFWHHCDLGSVVDHNCSLMPSCTTVGTSIWQFIHEESVIAVCLGFTVLERICRSWQVKSSASITHDSCGFYANYITSFAMTCCEVKGWSHVLVCAAAMKAGLARWLGCYMLSQWRILGIPEFEDYWGAEASYDNSVHCAHLLSINYVGFMTGDYFTA